MTIQELRNKYSEEELSKFPGDKQLRFEMFSPLFQNLYEQKVIYSEKILGIVQLKDVIITPEKFKATAIPIQCIRREHEFDELFAELEVWDFYSSWDWMLFSNDGSISVPYASWTVWTEPALVKKVEKLCDAGDYEEALNLLW